MNQNNLQNLNYEDGVDLVNVLQILIESKKILISTLLLFTTVGILLSFNLKPEFKSTTVLKIGYFDNADGTQRLIENVSELTSSLNIQRLLNASDWNEDLKFIAIENRLLKIETYSNSLKKNQDTLNSLIADIENRHNDFFKKTYNKTRNTLLNKIKLIDSEITFLGEKELDILEIDVNSSLYILQVKDKLFRLQQEQEKLKYELQSLMNQTQINTYNTEIETEILEPKSGLLISMSILIGFFSGVFFIFLNNFIIQFRNREHTTL